jgi:hypothetical protein
MSRMKPIARYILLIMIFSLVMYTGLRHAAAEIVVVKDNQHLFSIAVPDFADNSTCDGASWSTMAQIMSSDLKASGRVALMGAQRT